MFYEIENNKGKIKEKDIRNIFDEYEDQISEDIKNAINKRIKEVSSEYQESIFEAEKRLHMDLQQKMNILEMNSVETALDTSFIKALKFNFKDLAKGALKIFEYTCDGFEIGTVIPVIGNIIGAIIGFLAGIVMTVCGWFSSKESRINKAKSKVKEALDDQIDVLADEIKDTVKEIGLEEKIEEGHLELQTGIKSQREALYKVEQLLDVVTKSLEGSYKKINL